MDDIRPTVQGFGFPCYVALRSTHRIDDLKFVERSGSLGQVFTKRLLFFTGILGISRCPSRISAEFVGFQFGWYFANCLGIVGPAGNFSDVMLQNFLASCLYTTLNLSN